MDGVLRGKKRAYPYYVPTTHNSLWTEGERIRSCENIRQLRVEVIVRTEMQSNLENLLREGARRMLEVALQGRSG